MNNDTNTKISQNRQKKMDLTDELTARVQKSKGIVLTNYTGLTHQQLEGLKRAVKKVDAEFVVTKNTLLKRALATNNSELITTNPDDEVFDQPTATLFAYNDLIEPLKIVAKSIKDVSKPTIKVGFTDGRWLKEADVLKLSTLPAKPVLQAQLLGMMKSPIQNLHRALSWNMQALVMTLNAIQKQKS